MFHFKASHSLIKLAVFFYHRPGSATTIQFIFCAPFASHFHFNLAVQCLSINLSRSIAHISVAFSVGKHTRPMISPTGLWSLVGENWKLFFFLSSCKRDDNKQKEGKKMLKINLNWSIKKSPQWAERQSEIEVDTKKFPFASPSYWWDENCFIGTDITARWQSSSREVVVKMRKQKPKPKMIWHLS